MSGAAIHTEIRTKFATVWTTAATISWPNSEFIPPDLDIGEWCRVTIIDGQQIPLEMGSPVHTFRDTGQIIIQIFTPLDTGETRGLTLGDTVANAFRFFYGVSIKCQEAKVKGIGTTSDGWQQTNVVISYKYDSYY